LGVTVFASINSLSNLAQRLRNLGGMIMKPMIWHPEPQDQKVNQYLDKSNHEPWLVIVGIALMIVCSFTFLVLLGTF
jgi:hypothetical protein